LCFQVVFWKIGKTIQAFERKIIIFFSAEERELGGFVKSTISKSRESSWGLCSEETLLEDCLEVSVEKIPTL